MSQIKIIMLDPRQIKLIKNVENLSEFRGSLRRAIKDAGYSQQVADNPKMITDRKWFKEHLPSHEETSNAIRELMVSGRLDHYVFPLSMSDAEIVELIEELPGCKMRKIKHGETQTWAYFWIPDNKSRKDAIDIVLKVRGDYAPEKITLTDPYEEMSDDELDEELQKLEGQKAQRKENNGQQ